MTTAYTTVSVNLSSLDGSGDNGTLNVTLFQRITLSTGAVLPAQTFKYAITSGVNTGILVPSTDNTSCTPANVPLLVTYTVGVNSPATPNDGKTFVLGNILPQTIATTVTLASLLAAGGTAYTINAQPINVDVGGIVLIATLTALANTTGYTDQQRALVTSKGIYRWDANTAAVADGVTVVRPAGNAGAWIMEILGLNTVSPLSIALGGTGQTTASQAFNALSPITLLGDLIYGSGANTGARLAGNTAAAKQFLNQTGTGAVSAAPAWGALAATDINTALSVTSLNFYDMGGGCVGTPVANQYVLIYRVPRAMTLKAGLPTSQGIARTGATASTVFTIKKNGSALTGGTITFVGTTPTFALTSDTALAANDIVEIVAPGTPDATLANIGITLVAVLN